MMEELELCVFDVFYTAEDGYIDIFRCSAEDEEHAVEQFRSAYPSLIVEEVEYRGLA
jgi:hypothetical protein